MQRSINMYAKWYGYILITDENGKPYYGGEITGKILPPKTKSLLYFHKRPDNATGIVFTYDLGGFDFYSQVGYSSNNYFGVLYNTDGNLESPQEWYENADSNSAFENGSVQNFDNKKILIKGGRGTMYAKSDTLKASITQDNESWSHSNIIIANLNDSYPDFPF
jgi:hypothetical protein